MNPQMSEGGSRALGSTKNSSYFNSHLQACRTSPRSFEPSICDVFAISQSIGWCGGVRVGIIDPHSSANRWG
ncbi:hypothetical protein AB1N83_000430 [Pleurotus pulmonarius]